MRRSLALLVGCLMLGGCRIEPTPEHYIDVQRTPVDAARESEEELRGRLASLAPAIQRRSALEITGALAPHPDVHLIGPGRGNEARTAQGVVEALDLVGEAGALRADEVDVWIAPRNDVAWFRTEFRREAGSDSAATLHFSGVFVRQDGEWRLIQGHLSAPATELVPPAPPAAVGTPAGAG